MSAWAGFSEEELRRMQQKDSAGSAAAARGRKPVPATRSRQQIQREKALQLAAQKNAGAASLCLPPGQQLTKPPPPPEDEPKPAAPPAEAPAVKQEEQRRPTGMKPAPEKETPVVKELEKQEVALLTQAEAVKLKRIQKELQALDDMVSSDIGILRAKIEQASWEKRYEKAEAEYVTSKLDLHKKTEAKEQLTEHLCAIIQQNELRKALKLEELMQQLQLHATTTTTEEERGGGAETRRTGPAEGGGGGGGTERSANDCRPTEEEMKGGGVLREDLHPRTEPPKTEENYKIVENGVQSEIAAS
ncbi:hypothetical protein FQN60_016069 [Etheostoma spectabile]|uniref:RAB6-interacting golgin n=1 Tax=Etheostoma spectabile TaxID=54343 RepID=A0A5J5C9U3_9PERO|nr:hypothetical protein FQN60_016069 [Etheostoma spectabile]